jgi:basic amino acid/polyamine antiporter, APA family
MQTRNSGDEGLVRAIGTLGLAAAIVNITIGGGIFRLPANVAGSLGPAAPVAYIVCAIAMGLIVLCMADAGRRVRMTGGPYAYVGSAFGSFAAFLSGALLWMLGTFASAAVATVFASSVGQLVPALSGAVMQSATLTGALTFWTLVNARGVALGSRLNSVTTVAKLLPLGLLAVVGLFFISPAHLEWTTRPAPGDVARTSLLLIFAFAGIECALVPSGEVRDPARTVPRAIALAMIGVTTLYVLLQVVAQGILGDGLARATVAPLADAAGASLGGWARTMLLAGAAVSMFGNLGGMALAMPRMVYAFARDGFLPRALAALHPRYRSPQPAIVLQSALTLALALSGTFEKLAILANVSALALYFGCALAAWRLRARDAPDAAGAGWLASLTRNAPWLACIVIAWLLTSLTRNEWLAFGACLAAGTLVYIGTRGRRAGDVGPGFETPHGGS